MKLKKADLAALYDAVKEQDEKKRSYYADITSDKKKKERDISNNKVWDLSVKLECASSVYPWDFADFLFMLYKLNVPRENVYKIFELMGFELTEE